MENPFKKKQHADEKIDEDSDDAEEKKKRPVIRSATDLQRLKLEKLMKNPDKPVVIPEPQRERDYLASVPTFVRNVMGSSAGAGSGEFHVYRHLRRKEYARQKCIQAKSMKEQLDDEYRAKLERNRLEAEAKTAKKRAKRLKKKQRAKKPKTKQNEEEERKEDTTSDEEDDADVAAANGDTAQHVADEEKNEPEEKQAGDIAEEKPTEDCTEKKSSNLAEEKPTEDCAEKKSPENDQNQVESNEATEVTDSNEPNEEENK